MSVPKRILVYRIGQIGDTIAALPSLRAISEHFAGARIVILTEKPLSPRHLPADAILNGTGLVDGFELYPSGASVKNFLVTWSQIMGLRRNGFDTLIYLTPSLRSPRQRWRDKLFFRSCGIRKLLGFSGFPRDFAPRQSDSRLVTLPKESDALLARLRLDGLPVPTPGESNAGLALTAAERNRSAEWWRANGYEKPPLKWVAICPGSKWESKRWPYERYAEVGRRLQHSYNLLPVIVGGAEDREVGAKLLARWHNGLCAAGDLSVRESAALMETASFYLGNDTGTMHLAAAVKTPCVAVFSAQDWPGKWEPNGKGHKVLRFDPPCAGCRLPVCNRNLECLINISVEQVYQACVELMTSKPTQK